MDKLCSVKPTPGTKKAGDCCSRGFLPSSPTHLLTQRVLTCLLPCTLASDRAPPRLGRLPSTAGILPPQKGREGRGCKASSSVVLCWVFFFFSSCPTACVVTEHVHMQSPLGHQTGNSLLTVTWAIRDGSEAPSSGSIVADPQHQGSRCGPG